MSEFRSYYGRPVVKAPVWKWDIPAYLFTGGLSAGASLVAAGADATGRVRLRRSARWTSLAGIGVSTVFLVHDLGRPERFVNMLRVLRPTSPMSVGSWFLAAFGPSIGAAAVAELAGVLPERGPLGAVR
ncbi:MAG: NrfD/PsrC family molybdoenzyme membrane anchor subunit, partial [Actinomycetota bacterium]